MKSATLLPAFLTLVAGISLGQSTDKKSNTPQPATQAQQTRSFEFKTDISKMKVQVAKQGDPALSQNTPLLMEKPDRSFDRGIYAQSSGTGSRMCGAIVSYNFSPGENPQLQSVTTCTPSDAVVPQRARQQKPLKSPTPQLLQADFRWRD
ncbi:MAG TPA: hypothetical protein VE783_10960 [Candidatus Limnocylindrales bacterium]|nr:hypothetical protein [Candidatus Limnocylindrales bacterium]